MNDRLLKILNKALIALQTITTCLLLLRSSVYCRNYLLPWRRPLHSGLFFWWWSSYVSWFGYYSFFYDAILVPFLKTAEGFPNDWSTHGTMVWLLLYGLTENPSDKVSPCVTIFVYNLIIDRVRHSIHLFYLEQIDLEQSPSFTPFQPIGPESRKVRKKDIKQGNQVILLLLRLLCLRARS